jgi:hypothetical protein
MWSWKVIFSWAAAETPSTKIQAPENDKVSHLLTSVVTSFAAEQDIVIND